MLTTCSGSDQVISRDLLYFESRSLWYSKCLRFLARFLGWRWCGVVFFVRNDNFRFVLVEIVLFFLHALASCSSAAHDDVVE
jgi:hypothetical protein